ncbi:drug/metabolite transporter (DMT)-like permease [Rhizobium sp. BIGb0125]|uniref:DMT family transporter n=1 Tax=Rhizobium sp. BIGb0125 TaxID=2940618 RepID=UPI00216784CD|nr:DMT family transporter [Rhizobium sp. BIGb0125]MCS4242656.1 drug/metabolite transporter (DMT)-like permease [Rhizobium sp. BIGb0125]
MHTLSKYKLVFSRQELALIAITVVWGATFLIIHTAMSHTGPLFFVGLRFLGAAAICLVIFRKRMRHLTLTELRGGAVIGTSIFIVFSLQTFGLQTVNSSTSAFLTALYVPLVPLLQWLVLKRPPKTTTLVGVALAFAGLVMIAGPDALHVGLGAGEIATLLSAFAIAVEILLMSRFATVVDSGRISVVQCFVASALSFLAMPLFGEGIPDFSWVWLTAALGLAVASALIQFTMNWAQKTVSASRAAIIYAGEPVWGGIIGRMAGDRLPPLALLGALFIVAGVIVSELKAAEKRQDDTPLPDDDGVRPTP